MPLAIVGEHQLHYELRGGGEPVLLIMGLGATADYWGESFLAHLAGQFSLVTYDHRGIGRSARAGEDFTVAELAEDAVGLLHALEIPAAHVVGFSLGGMVAEELAARHPDSVRRLVLAGAAGSSRTNSALSTDTLGRLREAMVSSNPEQAIQAGLEANVSAHSAARGEVRAAWAEMVSRARLPLRTVERQIKAAQAHDATDRLGSIAAPTLILHGSEDRLVDSAHADELAAAVPAAQLVLFSGAGHMFFWEEPELSGEVIAAWLRGDCLPRTDGVKVRDGVHK